VPQKPAEQLIVVMKVNSNHGELLQRVILLPVEFISPWMHDDCESHSLWGWQNLRIPC